MKPILTLLFIAILGLQSCKIGTSGTWKDENISSSLLNEIQILDDKVLQAITLKNPDLLKNLMSEQLLKQSGDKLDQIINQVGDVISSKGFYTLNQFHVKNTKTGVGNTVLSGVSQLNDYVIHYTALNKEMFISIILPEDNHNELIITNIYGKYPDGWKLNIFQIGQYRLNGKTAPELYIESMENFEKGHLIDAANQIYLSSQVSRPANNFWQYQKQDEMEKFYEKVMTEIKSVYDFPVTIEKIKTKPQILNIFPFGMEEGYFPMVEYLTTINLDDKIKTRLENDQIHKHIGDVFIGLDKEKKYVFYKAYNDIPDGKTPVPTFGFVKENE